MPIAHISRTTLDPTGSFMHPSLDGEYGSRPISSRRLRGKNAFGAAKLTRLCAARAAP
jgi:hypothetical protein